LEYTQADDKSERPLFLLHYALTAEDYQAGYYFTHRTTRQGRRLIRNTRLVLGAFCAVFLFVLLRGLAPWTVGGLYSAFSYGMALVVLGIFGWSARYAPKNVAKKAPKALEKQDKSIYEPIELGFTEAELVFRRGGTGSFFTHDSITIISGNGENVYVCYENVNRFLSIPQRAFQDEAQRRAFLAELSARSGVPVT